MSISDFLTILGLAMAAWAFIANKERRFILLFFSTGELFIGIFFLLFIHFLMAFDWMKDNWFPGFERLTTEKGIPPQIWAYIIALLLIVYVILKVNIGFFSRSKLKNLISLYNTLLDENDIDLLANYVIKYHLKDIHSFLRQYSNIPEKDSIDRILRRKTETDRVYKKIIEKKRMRFAASVYGNIISNEEFIRKASNSYPELFAFVIKGMESTRSSNQDFVKLYLGSLFENRNQKLINELKILNGAHGSIKARCEYVDLPIMEGVMINTKVAADNYVWYPIAEYTMKSMKYDKEQLSFLQKKYDDDLEGELWQQNIYIAIVYFNYMVRETIYRDSGWHMWLFYYHYFVRELINNIPAENDCADSEHCSFNHYLIKEIIDNIQDWLELAAEQNTEDRSIDSLRCLGKILLELTATVEQKIAFSLKAELFESVITEYFSLSENQNTENASSIMTYMESMFKNPNNPDWHEVQFPDGYRQILAEAWDRFDKVPYEGVEDNGSIDRFENNILHPLGIYEE
jgi:hypothetical protein